MYRFIPILKHYDMRIDGIEFRMTGKLFGEMYSLNVNGSSAMTAIRLLSPQAGKTNGSLLRLWQVFTADMTYEDLGRVELVSKRYRVRRQFRSPSWFTVALEDEPIEPFIPDHDAERYPRSEETVSDILPDYRITLADIFEDYDQLQRSPIPAEYKEHMTA
jgi:hypothetical protein